VGHNANEGHGLRVAFYKFCLNIKTVILFHTKLFVDSFRKAKKHYANVNSILSFSKSQRFILYATRAQQWAAHSALFPRRLRVNMTLDGLLLGFQSEEAIG